MKNKNKKNDKTKEATRGGMKNKEILIRNALWWVALAAGDTICGAEVCACVEKKFI